MDPKNPQQFNPKTPVSEVLKQERAGYTPSAPKLSDVVAAMKNVYTDVPKPEADASKEIPTEASQIKIIKTYRSDAAEAIKNQQETLTKITIAQERQKREEQKGLVEVSSTKRIGLITGSIILLIIGVIAIPTVQYILSKKTQEVPIVVQKTIIPFDHQKNIVLENVTREDLLTSLIKNNGTSTAILEDKNISEKIQDTKGIITNRKIASDIFAGIIGPNMPPALARSFDPAYMFGTDNLSPFIIFKTSSYQQTFANMLKWESKMIVDLTPIFNLPSSALGQPFIDQLVINKDARVVTARQGGVLLLYGFLDNKTLLITTNPQTFQDINEKYVASQFVQ